MKRIAIFASGNGSNFQALAEACRDGRIPAEAALLVVDKPGAYVIERAKEFPDVEVLVLNPREFPSRKEFEAAIADRMDALGIDLVCLAGYMRIVGAELLSRYGGKIINIHPSLLPSFKGAHAIRDAFEYGVKVFGVTIHYVDETLDGGRIISQGAFPYEGTDIDELEGMIHALEHPLYIETAARLLRD